MEMDDLIFLGACILMAGRADRYSDPATMKGAIKSANTLWNYYLNHKELMDDEGKGKRE